MNYTTITIEGNKIGLKFGLASFRYLKDKFVEGRAFQNDELTEIGIAHILYSGYYNNCLIKDSEIKLTFEYFVDFIESNLTNTEVFEQIKLVLDIWSQNDFIKEKEVEIGKEEAKKKTTRGKK
jgi:hypothetical protein